MEVTPVAHQRQVSQCTREESQAGWFTKEGYAAEEEVKRLKDKVRTLLKQGDMVDSELHSDLLHIMNENVDQIRKAYPENSFSRLFWDEQLKAASTKDPRQVRWHPVLIKWCLNLKLLSSSAYHAMRTSGFLKLPSVRTLRDYICALFF